MQIKNYLTSLFLITLFFSLQNSSAQTYVVGQSYFSANGYIEYIPGDLPIIIGQPHDGQLDTNDTGIPIHDTSRGNDNFTSESTALLKQKIYEKTDGGRPHVIINHLAANILNLARSLDEATGTNVDAQQAWYDYHDFMEDAKGKVIDDWGTGHYFEMHGNGVSADSWTMVGLGVDNDIWDLSDSQIANAMRTDSESSIKLLTNTLTDAEVIDATKGPNSIGGYLNAENWKAAPSVQYPQPNNRSGSAFYRAGWNTWEHSIERPVKVDATHLENYWEHMKSSNRDAYINDLADAIINYMEEFYEQNNSSFDLDCSSYGTILREGFASGSFGDLVDINTNDDDCITVNNSTYANTGSWSVRLRDGNGNDSRMRTITITIS